MSTTRKALFTLAALGLAAFAAHPASAQTTVTGTITGLFATGVSSSNVVLANGSADPHYTITGPGVTSSSPVVKTVGFPIPPFGPYIGNSNTSAWIGPAGAVDLSGLPGLYTYTTTFQVSGLTGTGYSTITGNWATDDTGTDILINGVSTGNTVGSTEFSAYTPFRINATNLMNGTNTLTFLVNNAITGNADNPTALRVDGIKATDPVSAAPEPSQMGMLALVAIGLGALAFKARKRSTAQQTA